MVVKSTISPLLKLGLGLLGVWPDVPYAVARRLVNVLCALFLQYFQYMYIITHFKLSELQNLVDGLPATLYYTLTVIKMITFWKYQRVIREVLDIVDTDWRECVNIDRHLHLMMTKASFSHYFTHAFLGVNTVTGSLYFAGNNFIALMESANVTSRPFPIRLQLPFDAEQSPIYELLVVALFVHSMTILYTVNIFNSLAFTLVFHVSGQINIMCQDLKRISEKTHHYGSMSYATGTLIERHNKVITFSENINKLFSFIALMQVFCNTLVICFLGLVLMTSHSEIDLGLLKTICGYLGITMEIFVFCFLGEYLGLKNKSIGDAAYESLWYNMSSSHGKTLLFIILRSQKQQTITVGGITNLSLEAFTSIMKASASYMSVLNAMY